MLVGENLPPEKKNVRGRPPVCPNRLLATICILMQLEGPTFRDAENAVAGGGRHGRAGSRITPRSPGPLRRRTPNGWTGWCPSPPTCVSTRPTRHRRSGTAGLRPAAPAWRRTGTVYRRGRQKKGGDFKPTRVKTYLKWHILAAVGQQVILPCRMTPGSVADTTVFTDLLDGTGRKRRRLDRGAVRPCGRGVRLTPATRRPLISACILT